VHLGPQEGHHGLVPGIYDEPEFYAAACAYRDVPSEVDALLRWWRQHSAQPEPQPPRSVLELAAGPAEHARELAARGVAATALDINPRMCAWARARAAQAGLALTVVTADMRDFSLPAPVDLAITMLNSVCHLFTLDDLVAHLTSVAGQVTEGGLYIMELAHPADALSRDQRTSSDWVTDLDDGSVSVRWGGPQDRIDPITQVTSEHVVVTYRKDDGTVRTVTDEVPNRFWTATEVDAAIRLAGGFTIAARYGDFDGDVSLDAPSAWRLIMVLRRSAGAASP
jgi:SAM-dependent methyltransferase